MKLITERKAIARTINGHKLPVITIDLADADEYGLKSQKVLIDNGTFRDGFPYYLHTELRAYADERKFKFSQGGTCLKASFGYYDMVEMLEYRNAPIVKADSDVIVCIIDSRTKLAYNPMVLHTTKRIDAHCSTPLEFIDNDYSTEPFLYIAGVEIREEHK
jgi:hypothetical protein